MPLLCLPENPCFEAEEGKAMRRHNVHPNRQISVALKWLLHGQKVTTQLNTTSEQAQALSGTIGGHTVIQRGCL